MKAIQSLTSARRDCQDADGVGIDAEAEFKDRRKSRIDRCSGGGMRLKSGSILGGGGEIEIANLGRWHDHFKRLFSRRALRRAHHFHLVQHIH